MGYVVTGAISAGTGKQQYELQPGDPFPDDLAAFVGERGVERLVLAGAIQPTVLLDADEPGQPAGVQLPTSLPRLSVTATLRWVAEHDDPQAAAAAVLAHEQARPHPRSSLLATLRRTADPGDEAPA